jgi:DNA-binding transcriptional LysR family regulator
MDRYRRMAMLVAVVERGSIRRAAGELGLSPSAISQQIRRLEHEVGVTLLRRSTRRLTLTEAGEAFYEGCAAMVVAARSAHERLADLRHRLTLKPRVTSNNQFSITQLTLMGLGLSFHVEPEVAAELACGELVRVLPDWSGPTLSVDVLMPARTRQPAKIRMAVEALRGYLDRASVTRTKASRRNRVTTA